MLGTEEVLLTYSDIPPQCRNWSTFDAELRNKMRDSKEKKMGRVPRVNMFVFE